MYISKKNNSIVLNTINVISKETLLNKIGLLVDIETTNDDKMAFDVSFRVLDFKECKILYRFSIVLSDIFNTRHLINGKYSKNKKKAYKGLLKSGKYKGLTRQELYDLLNNLCIEFNIDILLAYNGIFDAESLLKTFDYSNKRTKLCKDKVKKSYNDRISKLDMLDIGTLCSYLYKTQDFKNWYDKYIKVYNKDGSRKVNCEIIHKYLLKEMDFVEEHTGQRDLDTECQLIFYALASSKVKHIVLNLPMTWGVRLLASDKGLSNTSKVFQIVEYGNIDYWFDNTKPLNVCSI